MKKIFVGSLTIAISFLTVLPATAGRRGINIERQCKVQYGYEAVSELRGDAVSDWKCKITTGEISYRSVSMRDACRNQYGVSNVRYDDVDQPYSWYCEVP